MTGQRIRAYSLSVLFIGMIAFPFLNDRFHFIIDTPSLENRRIAARPGLDPEHLDPYPAAFEKYYNDTFALRSRLINLFNIYNCVFLRKSTFPAQMIIGEEQWLYIVGPDIETYLGQNRLTPPELATLQRELEYRRAMLERQHCRFYLLIAPGKANVHPEHLPFTFVRENNQCWGEQLIAHLSRHSSIATVDLFSAYKDMKAPGDVLYYSDDNHWNHLGAFYAAQATVRRMAKDLPALQPLSKSACRIEEVPGPPGNLKSLLGNLDIFQSTDYSIEPREGFNAQDVALPAYPPPAGCVYPDVYALGREIANSDKPRLLIFGDSFGGKIFPYLAESFSRTVKIFDGWDYTLHYDMIEKEKPDAVLLIVHEPLLRNILRNLSYPGAVQQR